MNIKSLKTFLLEETETGSSNIIQIDEDPFKFIQKNCQQWFNEIEAPKSEFENMRDIYYWRLNSSYSFYRGLNFELNPDFIYVNKAINNRKPKDTPILIQESIDKALQQLGFTVLRKNSIFCSNSRMQAIEYTKKGAPPFLVFPMDGYEYLYSEKIYDLLFTIRYESESFEILKNVEYYSSLERDFTSQTSNPSLIEFYLYLKNEKKLTEKELRYYLEIDPEKFQKKYNFTNKNIKKHVYFQETSPTIEIMIRPKVILIVEDSWRNFK